MGNCGASSLPRNAQNQPDVLEQTRELTTSQSTQSRVLQIENPPDIQTQVIPETATTLIKVVPVRGSFAKCTTIEEVRTFFRDSLGLITYHKPHTVYDAMNRSWELVCEEGQYNALVDPERARATYHVGHTTIKFCLVRDLPHSDSVDLLVVVPSTPEGPVLRAPEIVKQLSRHFDCPEVELHDEHNSDREQCWRAYARVSPRSVADLAEGRSVQVEDHQVLVRRAPEKVWVALVRKGAGELPEHVLQAEEIDELQLEEVIVGVFRLSKGARVRRVPGKGLFECASLQDLGCLKLGDPAHNHLLVRGVDYRCVQAPDTTGAQDLTVGATWVCQPSPTRESAAPFSPGSAAASASPTSVSGSYQSLRVDIAPPSLRAPAACLPPPVTTRVESMRAGALSALALEARLQNLPESAERTYLSLLRRLSVQTGTVLAQGGAAGAVGMLDTLRRQLAEDGCDSEEVIALLDAVEAQWATRSATETAGALRAALEEVFYLVDLPYIAEQLYEVWRLTSSLSYGKDVLLVLSGSGQQAALHAMRQLTAGGTGEDSSPHRCGPALVAAQLRGEAVVALCPLEALNEPGDEVETELCRYHTAAVALKKLPAARLLLILPSPSADAAIDVASLLHLPLSLCLTKEQLVGCTYWFAPSVGSLTDGGEICRRLQTLLQSDTVSNTAEEELSRAILSDIVAKAEALGGAVVVDAGQGASTCAVSVSSILATTPVSVSSLALKGSSLSSECAKKVDLLAQRLLRSVRSAATRADYPEATNELTKLKYLHETLHLGLCETAYTAAVAAACPSVPSMLADLAAEAERREANSAALGWLEAGIVVLCEALVLNGQLPSLLPLSAPISSYYEEALIAYLAHVRKEVRSKLPGVDASNPSSLPPLTLHIKLVLGWGALYPPAPAGVPASDPSALSKALQETAQSIHSELVALDQRLQNFFPVGADLSDLEVDAELTWSAVLVVEGLRTIGAHNSSQLVFRVQEQFARCHATRNRTEMEKNLDIVTATNGVLTADAVAKREAAAAALKKAVLYMERLSSFYHQRRALPEHAVAAASELLRPVFVVDVDVVYEKLEKGLAAFRTQSKDPSLSFSEAVRGACVTDWLSGLDEVLQPQDPQASNSWVGHAKLSAAFHARVATMISGATASLSDADYPPVKAFLSGCNRADVAEATSLADLFTALTDHVNAVVSDATAAAKGLELSLSSASLDLADTLARYSALCSLQDLLSLHLNEGLQTTLSKAVEDVRAVVVSAAVAHYDQIVVPAARRGDFPASEAALQLVERSIVGTHGSVEKYHAWVASTGAPVAHAIDPDGCRQVAGEYVSKACGKYDQAFSAVTENFTAAAEVTSPPTNDEAGSQFDEDGGDRDSKQGQQSCAPTGSRSASVAEVLHDILALQPPKAVAEALRLAIAECGSVAGAGHYEAARKTLVDHLAGKVNGLLLHCKPSRGVSFDRRQHLLVQLERLQDLLPPGTWRKVARPLEERKQTLQAEYDTVARLCTKDGQSLPNLVAQLASYVADREYTFCRAYVMAIASSICASAAALQRRLSGGKERTEAMLLAVVEAWTDWSRFRQLCDQLGADKEYMVTGGAKSPAQNSKRSTAATVTTTDTEAAFVEIQSLTKALGDRLRLDLAGAAALSADAAGVFAQLEPLTDLAILLYNTFQSPTARKDLQDLRENIYHPSILETFFSAAIEVLSHHPKQIATALTAAELDCAHMAGLLQAFDLSRGLHAKVKDFAASEAKSPLTAQDNFSGCCRTYDAVVGEVVAGLTARADAVRVVLLSSPDLQEGASPETRNTFFTHLVTVYAQVQSISALQSHIGPAKLNIKNLIAECEAHLSSQVTAVRDHLAVAILSDGSALPGSSHTYKHWYDNLSAFAEAFKPWASLATQASEAMGAAHSRLIAVVTAMVDAAAAPQSDADLVARLVDIKAVAETIAPAKEEVDALLDALLSGINCDLKRGPQDITRLALLLSDVRNDLQDFAQRLINDHAVFKGYLVNLFNTRVLQFSFGEVLGRTRAETLVPEVSGTATARTTSEPVQLDAARLEQQHQLFNDAYRALVTDGLRNVEASKQLCVDTVEEIKACPLTPGYSLGDKVRELLVQLFGYWTLSNAHYYFETHGGQSAEQAADNASWKYLKQPHPGQIVSLFRMFGLDSGVRSPGELENHLVQVGTGEGKSVILAMAACVFALLGNAVHCVCYSMYLYQRDESEFVSLFDAFGVREAITYGTFQGLCELYLNRSGDIRKSMQAIVETPSGQRWSRGDAEPSRFPADDTPKVLLIDEVDVFFKGDFYGSAFRPMAALSDATVSALLDYVWANRDGFVEDTDAGAPPNQEPTLAPPVAQPVAEEVEEEEDLAAAVRAAVSGAKAPARPTTHPSRTPVHVPAAAPTVAEVEAPRRQLSKRVTLAKIKSSRQYRACVERYPQWDYFIDEAIRLMLIDIKTFRTPKYPMEVVNGQIGYRIQDRIDTTMVDGYKTLFSYYDEHEKNPGLVSKETLQSKKCIHIDCGAYSYAEIPKVYQHLVGVSGTLASLQDAERDILRSAYDVRRLTYTASVYSETASKLKFQDNADDIRIVSAAEHFPTIFEEIKRRRTETKGDLSLFRPVLVFFKTAKQVEEFERYLQAPQHFAKLTSATLLTITEKNDGSEKESRIKNAVLAGTVALLSRELGRGTDFIVRSDRIDAAGGVHVIQTFLSADVSEETQIKGRTARQGKEGSYSMVLAEEELQADFQIQATGEESVQIMQESRKFMTTLSAKRDACFVHRYEELEKTVAVLRQDFEESFAFLANLAQVPSSTAPQAGQRTAADEETWAALVAAIFKFLQHRNQCHAPPLPVRLSRTLVLLDATVSMEAVLHAAKVKVLEMFTEARMILEEAGNPVPFQVQFAVYRNYDVGVEGIYNSTGWQTDAELLRDFLEQAGTMGSGLLNEAIEIGLWHANQEVLQLSEGERFQVVLIGDAPPHTLEEVEHRRYAYPVQGNVDHKYWNRTEKYAVPTYYKWELDRLILEEIPVYTFYILRQQRSSRRQPVQTRFEEIAEATGARAQQLSMAADADQDVLKRLITERILVGLCDGEDEARRMLDLYTARFGMGSG